MEAGQRSCRGIEKGALLNAERERDRDGMVVEGMPVGYSDRRPCARRRERQSAGTALLTVYDEITQLDTPVKNRSR